MKTVLLFLFIMSAVRLNLRIRCRPDLGMLSRRSRDCGCRNKAQRYATQNSVYQRGQDGLPKIPLRQ